MKARFEEYDARMIFKENLATLMQSSGITQKDIVEKTGKNPSTVSDWVHGKKYPRVDVMQVLANIFDVSIQELTCRESDAWQHKIANAYAKSSLDSRMKACQSMGLCYIRIYDDRELVALTRIYYQSVIQGNMSKEDACAAIESEYRTSCNSAWKQCTITVYHACLSCIMDENLSVLDDVSFDDIIDDDNFATITLGKILSSKH